ncbi:MAG: tetratricopeptide repeat protein [Anaerolineae bacterium]|nr:tetratricopeptide repeat protein [Anaerolineae bacterium]
MKRLTICLMILGVLGTLLIALPITSAQSEMTCDDLAPATVPASLFVGMGDAYFAQGDQTLAILAYTCGLAQDDTYTPAYVNRGFAHLVQHNDTAAEDDFNRALELDDASVAAYNNRGLLYLSQGNFGLAITDFTLAITFDPNYAIAYHNRALVHAAERNYDLALADLQQAIVLDPEYAAPHATLGAVYAAMALESYQTYADIAGEGARLPGGEPDSILNAQKRGLETNDFSIWLIFWTPAY